ncbi:hypothetical protein ACHQM5_018295 [Ranunculus cassubicifolius]
MDGSQGGSSSGSPAPFLTKTYEMVDDSSTNSVVSWSPTNNSFVVWNTAEFARDLLPKYFKHNNFSSFVRQLNTYGFRKIDPDQWEFANDEFIRGQKNLLKNIHRRKPIHSHSLQNHGQGPLTESLRQELEEEIEKLKHDKGSLLLELQRHTQERKGMEVRMQSLQTRLQGMEHYQRKTMSYLAQIMQRPGYMPNLMHQPESQTKKRRLPNGDFFCEEADNDHTQMVIFRASSAERSDAHPTLMINTEPFEKLEQCVNAWEKFLYAVGEASGEEMSSVIGEASLQPYAAILTEMRASSGDTQSPKLLSTSSHSKDTCPSPELPESPCYMEGSAISSLQQNPDAQTKNLEIDVNSQHVSSKDEQVRASSATPTGANDGFWEQFLTESPGSAETPEVQSERRDMSYKKLEIKSVDRGKMWWNPKSVDNLTEQMGQLTPAEKT